MASTVEASVQPSTSNLISGPLIPITAEIVVDNIQSQAVGSGQSMASTVVGSLTNSTLLAAIGSQSSSNLSESSQSDLNTPPTQQQMLAETSEKNSGSDEPEPKRRKMNTPCKSKTVEKLEARLGGILCCAVCLDLPRTAMYQVRFVSHSFV